MTVKCSESFILTQPTLRLIGRILPLLFSHTVPTLQTLKTLTSHSEVFPWMPNVSYLQLSVIIDHFSSSLAAGSCGVFLFFLHLFYLCCSCFHWSPASETPRSSSVMTNSSISPWNLLKHEIFSLSWTVSGMSVLYSHSSWFHISSQIPNVSTFFPFRL